MLHYICVSTHLENSSCNPPKSYNIKTENVYENLWNIDLRQDAWSTGVLVVLPNHVVNAWLPRRVKSCRQVKVLGGSGWALTEASRLQPFLLPFFASWPEHDFSLPWIPVVTVWLALAVEAWNGQCKGVLLVGLFGESFSDSKLALPTTEFRNLQTSVSSCSRISLDLLCLHS